MIIIPYGIPARVIRILNHKERIEIKKTKGNLEE
jgi:hypothetical protein